MGERAVRYLQELFCVRWGMATSQCFFQGGSKRQVTLRSLSPSTPMTIMIVSVQDFRNLFLPIVHLGPVKQTLDDNAVDRIRTRCVVDSLTKTNSRWTRFAQNLRRFTKTNEEAFKSFQGLWNDVIERVMELYPGAKPLVQVAFRPTKRRPVCVAELEGHDDLLITHFSQKSTVVLGEYYNSGGIREN
jgi:hypothetical protein